MSWEDIIKIGGEEPTRDDKLMITSTKRFMHRYSSDYYNTIMPFDPKETTLGNQGVYSTSSKEQAQEVADKWNKNNPTKKPYSVEEIEGRFYVAREE
jgi:hypothetical protein|tara:strand:+ start:362 stop:652 length:291 start_codon:yes stop_codon:yes gene_type:complete